MKRPQTTRGLLWQIVVPVFRWPLYSPKRFLVVAATLIGLFWATVALNHSDSATPGSSGVAAPNGVLPSPTGSSSGTSAASPATVQPWSDSPAMAPATATGDPLTQARRFAVAWARPGLPQSQWLAGISPYVTSSYRDELSLTRPSTVPASRVGRAELAGRSRTSRVVHLQTSPAPARGVDVTLVPAAGQWRVSRVSPA